MMTRRFLLAAAAVTSAAATLPSVPALAIEAAPAAAPPPLPRPAWVVGTPGEYNWGIVRAATESEAIKSWVAENCEHDYEEDEDGKPLTPCECIACAWEIGASRVPEFDGVSRPSPGDWMRAGLGHTCSRCGYETDSQNSGHGIGDEAVCEDCMTPEDWQIADPERYAEMIAKGGAA